MAEFYHTLGVLLVSLGFFFLAAAAFMAVFFGFHKPLVKWLRMHMERKKDRKKASAHSVRKKDRKEEEEAGPDLEEGDKDPVSPSSDLSGEDTDQSTLAPEASSFRILEEIMLVHDNPEDYKRYS